MTSSANAITSAEIELLDDLRFLLLARRETTRRHVERYAERHVGEKPLEMLMLFLPVDDARQARATQHEILGDGHARDQGEMLVHHAEAKHMGGARAVDLLLALADDDLALVRPVIAHDAFDERALARAILAEEGMEAARCHPDRDIVERGEAAEALRHADGFDAEGLRFEERRGGHATDWISASELETEPKTPPCILIILTA